VHTVILGNGILATTIAFRLVKRLAAKDRITIIGKRARPGSATLAAAAMLNSFAEIEAGSLKSELDRYRFELSRAAGRMWPKFEKEIIEVAGDLSGGGLELGTYVINNAAADDLDDENFDAIVAALGDFGEPFEHVSPREIPNYMPEQRHRATRALYIPGEGWTNPRLVLERLDAILAHHPQVTFVDDGARNLLRQGDRIGAVKVETGRVIAGDSFVLATGATASDVLRQSDLGIKVQRVFYGVGAAVEIKSPDFPHKKCIRTPNRGLACGLYSVPYLVGSDVPGDHILVGASNFISPTPYNYGRLTSIEALIRGAIEQINLNFYRADLVQVKVGWRPTTLDTYPLLGRTSIGNLTIATGTRRDGFHLAPLISEKIVALLFNEPVEEGFARFSPEREPIRSMSRQEAIEKAVRHQMSASYQHGFTPARSRMPAQIAQMHREDLERLHDQVGADDWGIPPEMLDMYRYGHAAT
jgi:glycine oxidase